MGLGLEITVRGMEAGDLLRREIEDYAGHLERFARSAIHCRVLVEERPSRHHHVHVHVDMPRASIDTDKTSDGEIAPGELHMVVRDTFTAMQRLLREYVRWHPEP